ncbi:MAG: putative ABC transporter permease [Lachnospiraceae bacterium]|nr:putative ABC transporter permease [Lachnospiraceae bacterium]
MWISSYVCLFIVYSFLGWIYESIFCTIKTGKWQERGFLYGPICPIYGVGAILIYDIFRYSGIQSYADVKVIGPVYLDMVLVFIIAVIGSAIMEYVTATVLENVFHAVWWDYSRLPFNIKGRISLFSSLGFGVAGILVVNYIAPWVEHIVMKLSPIWMEGLSLVCVAVFFVDFTLTVSALANLERIAKRVEKGFNARMENLVESAIETTHSAKERLSFEELSLEEMKGRLSKFQKMAVRRARSFRYKGNRKERILDFIAEVIKR